MHQCRDCKHFHEATEKKPFGLDEVAFQCPVTGEHRLSRPWISCQFFGPASPNTGGHGEPAHPPRHPSSCKTP